MDLKTNAALLVIDYEDHVIKMIEPGGSHSALGMAHKALEGARKAGIPAIFVTVSYRPGHIDVSPRNKRGAASKAANALVTGSHGTDVAAILAPREDEGRVIKRRVGAFSFTDLPALLSARDIKTLIVCGISTSGCVLSTVRHAADHDYTIVVLEDACADLDPEVQRVLMTKVFPKQAEVMRVEKFLQAIG